MNASTGRTAGLLDTSQSLAHLQWSQLLELQVAAFFATELKALLSSPGWRKASRVLDGGCGNGYYLSQLRAYFPDKDYSGVDLSREHIEAARSNPQLSGTKLLHANLFDLETEELFDAIMLRLVVQHLHGLQPLLTALNRLVAPDGSVFILEPDPSAFQTFPETPLFFSLLQSWERASATNRAQLAGLPVLLSKLDGWMMVQCERHIVPAAGSFGRHPFLQIFSLWLDIFQRSRVLDADFGDVRRELDAWAALPTAFCQVGFVLIELRRSA